MNGPPEILLRLTHYLGGEPRHTFSRDLCWFLVVAGVVEIVLTEPFLVISGPTRDSSLTTWTLFIVGIFIVAQGAEGLLREKYEGFSLWFRVLQTLVILPLIPLVAVQMYSSWGLPRVVVWVVVVAAILAWNITRRKRRLREASS